MNLKFVKKGLYRSDEPANEVDFQQMVDAKIRWVIDLDDAQGESIWEANACVIRGMQLLKQPMSSILIPSSDMVNKILAVMDGGEPGSAVLVHCRHGWDRTGLIVGMYRRKYQGMSRRNAWQDMLDNGFHWYLLGLTEYFWTH